MDRLRLGYLSGAPRVSTPPEALASGPRAHVLGVISGFRGRIRIYPTFRTPLTPGGNSALSPADAPRSRDGGQAEVVSRILWVKHGGPNGPRGAQEVNQG